MTTFAGIKSTEALKKQTDLPQHFCTSTVCRFSTKKGCFECQCFYKFWCPLVFSPSRLRPCRIYFLFAWYVWLWDVRIKWSPSPSGGLRHKHKATSVSSSSDCKLTMLAGLHMNNDYESCGYKRWICRVFVYNVRLCFITKIIFPFHILFADQLGGFTAPPACPHLSTSVLLMVVCPFFWCRCG